MGKLLRKEDGLMFFRDCVRGYERNYQTVLWSLDDGSRIELSTHVFLFSGESIAAAGGPRMPLFRTVRLIKKGFLRGRDLFSGQDHNGAFLVLSGLRGHHP